MDKKERAQLYRTLRIVFCIVSVMCCAAAILVFVYLGWWGMACVLGALASGMLMVYFKRRQEALEESCAPPAHGDFITGPLKRDDGENGSDSGEDR